MPNPDPSPESADPARAPSGALRGQLPRASALGTFESSLNPFVERYAIEAFPRDHELALSFRVTINLTAGNLWSVTHHESKYLADDGTWSWGYDDSDEWRARHHHPYVLAVALAQKALQTMTVAGRTLAQHLAAAGGIPVAVRG